MKNFYKITILLTFMSSILTLNIHAAELGVNINNLAPDFEVVNMQGKHFRLSEFRGKKPVYLVFWATWCPACKKEIPEFIKFHEEYGDQVEFLAINIDSISFWSSLTKSNNRVKKYIEKNQLPYAIALDDKGKLTKLYNVEGTPTQILIDESGVIRRRYPFLTPKTKYVLNNLLKQHQASTVAR